MTEERPLGPGRARRFDIRMAEGAGPAPRAFDHARGSNQNGVRLYNERLILSLIRRHRSLSKVEIGRLSCDLVRIDFLVHVLHRLHETYPYPLPDPLTRFVADNLERLTRTLP